MRTDKTTAPVLPATDTHALTSQGAEDRGTGSAVRPSVPRYRQEDRMDITRTQSAAMVAVLQTAQRYAETPHPVLIMGETGVEIGRAHV